MGQQKVKRAYNAFARQRIADKLDFLQRLHPGLSQEDMAGEIEDETGQAFDRKYFSRLRKENLSDAVTDRIVRWIAAAHDPNFPDTLTTEQETFSPVAVSGRLVLSRKEWVKVSREEAKLISPWAGAAFGFPEGYADSSSFDVRAVSFLSDTRIFRMSLYRKGGMFSVPLFLLEREGIFAPLQSLRQLQDYQPSVGVYTAADIAAFYFECIDASKPVDLFASPLDLTYHLQEKQGLHIAAAAALVKDRFGSLFEPPMLQETEQGSTLRIDAGSKGHYRRLLIGIAEPLQLTVLSDRSLAEFPDKRDADVALPPAGGLAVSLTSDLEPYLDILRETSVGRLLVRVLELRPAQIKTVPGSRETFVYDEDANLIVHTRPIAYSPAPEHTALALALCLRMLDQYLLGMVYTDPLMDGLKYSTIAHTKNLDAIINVCRIAIELGQSPRGAPAYDFIASAGLSKVFDAVQRGASENELFDAYTS